MGEDITMMTHLEALQLIKQKVEESYQAFRPVIGQRHTAIELYEDILKAESALLVLCLRVKEELEKKGKISP
jgi:hypothetical protein